MSYHESLKYNASVKCKSLIEGSLPKMGEGKLAESHFFLSLSPEVRDKIVWDGMFVHLLEIMTEDYWKKRVEDENRCRGLRGVPLLTEEEAKEWRRVSEQSRLD